MKKISIITILCLIFISIFIYYYITNRDNEELYLGEWDGVLYTVPENQLIINLIGISGHSIKELQENILSIDFKNTEQLEINSFNITTSNEKFQGKKIFTIEVDCSINENTEEIINEVIISYNNGKTKNYDIGRLKVISLERNDLLTQSDVHFLSFDTSDVYRNSIKNNSESDIILKDLQIENHHLEFTNITVNGKPFKEDITIHPNEEITIESEMSSKSNQLLYIVSPKYIYEVDTVEYNSYLDPSVVNVLELKEEQLNHMLSK